MLNEYRYNTISELIADSKDVKKRISELLKIIDTQLVLFKRFIDKFGTVKCLNNDSEKITQDDLIHDFFLYGLTKSCKSFLATRILCENFFKEDAQILLRPTYETYLTLQFVYKNPTKLDYYTKKSLGVALGYIKHPVSQKGRMLKNKIINPAKTLALIAIADCRAIVRRAKLTRLPDNIAGIKMEKA